jgi:hypothetical protein
MGGIELHGGGCGLGNSLKPLARWLQCGFVWMMGFEYEQILEVLKNGNQEVEIDNIERVEFV